MAIEKMVDGHKEFKRNFEKNRDLYSKLVNEGQHPKVLWIGCSDSRVVPEFIVNAQAGDLFVMRNIANIIPPSSANDVSTGAVLEYAVLELKVEHIVICGHTGCGGVTALVHGVSEGTMISKWLSYAESALEDSGEKNETTVLETIRSNIHLQAEHLLSYDFIQNNAQNLQIHQWLYDMNSGDIFIFNDLQQLWINMGEI